MPGESHPPPPPAGQPGHQGWGWASGLSGPIAVKKPPPGPCPLPGVSARDQLPGAQRQAVPRPAAGEPGVRRGTHNVGAHGAEGRGATGEQVAAVEWQEDLDVVLTVPLEEGGGCQAQASHQGAPPSPPHGCKASPGGEASAPQYSNPGVNEAPGASWGRAYGGPRSVCAGGGPWASGSSVIGKLLFSLG